MNAASQGVTGYLRVLRIGPFRWLFLGQAASSVGDGAGYLAVAWLALQLASGPGRPYAVGLALGAYALPGAVLGLLAAGRLSRIDPRRLLLADAAARLLLLGAVPVLYASGVLSLVPFLLLVAGSSALDSLGRGSTVTVVAAVVPAADRFAANSLTVATESVALTLLGPAAGGVAIAAFGAPVVLALDALSFGALLAAAARLPRHIGRPAPGAGTPVPPPVRLLPILRRAQLTWLVALTFVFYGLYGPIETALPIFVRTDLGGGSTLYGGLWVAYGVGALIGGLAAGTRTVHRVERFAAAVVAGWGLAVVLLGSTGLAAVACLGIALGGLVYAPYPALTTTVLQHRLRPEELTAGAAAWFALLSIVTPGGSALGGPLVAAVGARTTILGSGAATVCLALLVAGGRAAGISRHRRRTTTAAAGG